MVKERGRRCGEERSQEGCGGRCFRRTISTRMVKLETSGHERYQMRLEWTWEIHWASRQPEEAESKRLICRQHRALHTEAAAADQGQRCGLWMWTELSISVRHLSQAVHHSHI